MQKLHALIENSLEEVKLIVIEKNDNKYRQKSIENFQLLGVARL